FNDPRKTTIYVSSTTGQVIARRNDIWRLYDFFWMLHIMDYRERVNFNHALLIGASALALGLAASGFWLLFYRVRLRR
ncbi:MAG: PepSY domain-containing protein, partial [Gammaproteobacteria bacterium]|nr:PepSY domain-containing protein [Gammaproteobacteria bacterium]